MKRILVGGLLMLALAATAMAQTRLPQATPAALPLPGMPLAPAQQPTLPPVAPTAGAPVVIQADCCPPCKTCVREPATRTITRVCYSKVCEEFCLPKCSCCFANLCGGCLGCEPLHTKYYLVKKVRTETCPTTKCVPALAPLCGGCVAPACR